MLYRHFTVNVASGILGLVLETFQLNRELAMDVHCDAQRFGERRADTMVIDDRALLARPLDLTLDCILALVKMFQGFGSDRLYSPAIAWMIMMTMNTGTAAVTKASSHQNAKESMFKSSPNPGNHQLSQEAKFNGRSASAIAFIFISPYEI